MQAELFGGFAAGAVGEGGFTQGNVQQRQQLLFSQLQSRNAGGSEQEVPVTFDSAGNLIGEAVGDAVMEALAGSEAGVPDPRPDPLGTFSLTRGEREVLAPYQTAVREAENAIEDLTEDSTPQEIADAYQALVFAQTNLSNISEGIIRAAAEAERITGTAATNAITNLGLDLGDDLRTANNSLISTLGDVGFEVVGGIENIREAIDVSDISSAFRRIPEEVEAAAEAEPEPEAEPDVLAGVHRFSGAESRRLGILRTNVDAAEDAVRLLDENSTEAEITAAYTDLADAERDLYATQIGFIQSATGITEEARQDAFTLAEGVFGRELFDANQKLVRALGDVGLQLVAMFDATTGILRGTALATQQIPVEAEEAADEADPDETDPVAILRSNARLAANQVRRSRTGLGQATSESDFETRRVGLIQSVNAAYTAQITLLDALGLSAADYQDRFEDAEDARDAALTRATSSVNTFAEARIKGEEDVAEAAQDAADEAIDAAARTERERVRIAERAARESQRIAERQQRDIQGLRDDALEAERDRADALVELEEDTQERITDIIRDANRSKADIEQDFQRDFQDITRERTEAQNDVIRQRNAGSITSAEADERFEALARESADRLTELGIERRRDLEDAGIRQGRRIDDANIRQERGVGDINAQATATATAIQEALTPLLEQQQTGEVEVAEKQIEAADAQTTAAEQTESAATNLGTVATALNDSDIPGVIDLARQSAEASLGISSAILALPGLLETSFEKIFDDLQETIVDILRIEEGISGGVGQFLLDTLIDSEGHCDGDCGTDGGVCVASTRY